MARDNSGNYSVPTTLTAGTTARASDINTLVDDLGDEITDSLSRTGKGAMSAALKATAGTAGAPSLTFESDTDTGLYLKASNKLGISGGGSEVAYFGSSSAVIAAAAAIILSATSVSLPNATGFSVPSTSSVSFANAATLTLASAAKFFAGTVQVPPTGSIMPYAGSSAPTGWLFCNGQVLATTGTYAALYAVLGNTYDVMWGASSPGAGNFRVPDLRGSSIFGWEGMGSLAGRITSAGSGINGNAIAAYGGAQNITLDVTQIPAHTHSYQSVQVTASGAGGSGPHLSGLATTTGSTGGGSAHNNMPPAAILPFIIKF